MLLTHAPRSSSPRITASTDNSSICSSGSLSMIQRAASLPSRLSSTRGSRRRSSTMVQRPIGSASSCDAMPRMPRMPRTRRTRRMRRTPRQARGQPFIDYDFSCIPVMCITIIEPSDRSGSVIPGWSDDKAVLCTVQLLIDGSGYWDYRCSQRMGC